MSSTKKDTGAWLLGGLAIAGVGALAYYLWRNRKPSQKQERKDGAPKEAAILSHKHEHKSHGTHKHGPKRIVFIGPPGAGKGTQGPKLKEKYGCVHLATGDLLRAAVAKGTEMGKKAKVAMDAGKLVTDDIVIGMIKEAISNPDVGEKGYILDGFPRSVVQMHMLEDMLVQAGHQLDAVVQFKIDDNELIERICGRLIHKASGRTYHMKFNAPLVPGKDDVTGEDLIRRPDDNEATLVARLKVFHEETAPLLDHYRSKGLLTTIDASQPIDLCLGEIEAALQRRR